MTTATLPVARTGDRLRAVPLSASRQVECTVNDDGTLRPVAVFHRWPSGALQHGYDEQAACARCGRERVTRP